MSQTLSIATFFSLFNFNGLYLIAYGWLFGMSLWISFFGGKLRISCLFHVSEQRKALSHSKHSRGWSARLFLAQKFNVEPRAQFGALQHKTFPIYFVLSMGLGATLLGLWTINHPAVATHYASPLVADVAQAYTLAFVILAQGSNYFVVCFFMHSSRLTLTRILGGSVDQQVRFWWWVRRFWRLIHTSEPCSRG